MVILLTAVGLGGSLGGALNGLIAYDGRLLPSRIQTLRHRRLLRPGLIGSAIAGSGGSVVVCSVLAGSAPSPPVAIALAIIAGVALGTAIARCLTAECDKRLLRAALVEACAAPAAHPDTTRVIEIAPPYLAFLLACDLAPFDKLTPHKRHRSHEHANP